MTEAEIVKQIKADIAKYHTEIKQLDGASTKDIINWVFANGATIVELVEFYAKEYKGADKKKLATEVICSYVNIPWIPDAVEPTVVSKAIDLIVACYNKVGGKEWVSKIFAKAVGFFQKIWGKIFK